MKILKYYLCTVVASQHILTSVEMDWSEANEQIAKQEAYNGEYSIVEVDDPEPQIPTQLDIIEAQVAYTAMMTNTLLEV